MKADKFGVAAFVIGIVILVAVLHFVFMEPAGGWSVDGLVDAIVATVWGGLILLGIILMVVGILLLVL
jgi:hypothetical protein